MSWRMAAFSGDSDPGVVAAVGMGVAGYFDDVAVFKEEWRIEAVADLMVVIAVVVVPAVPTNAFPVWWQSPTRVCQFVP